MTEPIEEGWWMPWRSRKYHYFVEGRSLCGGWMFPNYEDMTRDTGETEKRKDDCAACFKKLVKLRASRASDNSRSKMKCGYGVEESEIGSEKCTGCHWATKENSCDWTPEKGVNELDRPTTIIGSYPVFFPSPTHSDIKRSKEVD